MSSWDDLMDQNFGKITSTHPHERVRVFQELAKQAQDHTLDIDDENTSRLLDCIELTLSRYQGKLERQAVVQFILAWYGNSRKAAEVREVKFLNAMLDRLKKFADATCRPSGPSISPFHSSPYERATAFSWILVLISDFVSAHPTTLDDNCTKIWSAFVNLASILMESLYLNHGRKRSVLIAARNLVRLQYRSSPSILALVSSIVLESKSSNLAYFGILLDEAFVQGTQNGDTDQILDLIYSTVINARSEPKEYRIDSFSKLFKNCNVKLLEDKIFRPAKTLILRSPEVVLPNLCWLTKHVDGDLSAVFVELAETLTNQLRSSNEIVRSHATALLSLLVTKAANKDVIQKSIKNLTQQLDAKGASVEMKLLVLQVISNCTDSVSAMLLGVSLVSSLSASVLKEGLFSEKFWLTI